MAEMPFAHRALGAACSPHAVCTLTLPYPTLVCMQSARSLACPGQANQLLRQAGVLRGDVVGEALPYPTLVCMQFARSLACPGQAHLELRQAGVLRGDVVGETLHHGLLHGAHKAERLLLLDGHLLLVLLLQQLAELVQRPIKPLHRRQAIVLRKGIGGQIPQITIATKQLNLSKRALDQRCTLALICYEAFICTHKALTPAARPAV